MRRKTFMLAASAISMALFAGCNGNDVPPTGSGHTDEHGHAHDDHGHHHADVGIHGGVLIELGNENYHGELVHDEKAKSIAVYLLDAAASGAVPIDARELIINVTRDGKAQQFKLTAEPLEGEPQGKASRFTSSDAALIDALHEADAQLVVTIDGKQYRGAIEAHEHGHADHAHD